MIKQYIVLPLILSAFERDSKRISSVVKTPGPYLDAITSSMNRITADLASIKREFRSRGIKVFDEEVTEAGVRASYNCRGYVNEFGIITLVLKPQAETYMKHYLNNPASNN